MLCKQAVEWLRQEALETPFDDAVWMTTFYPPLIRDNQSCDGVSTQWVRSLPPDIVLAQLQTLFVSMAKTIVMPYYWEVWIFLFQNK